MVTVNGREREIALIEKKGSLVRFEVEGTRYEVEVRPLLNTGGAVAAPVLTSAPPPPAPVRRSGKPGEVSAPMPGIIVTIAVKPGDTVSAAQTVVVMEAMKMENNIAAGQAGTVKEILVKPGQQVENGQPLVRLA